MQHRYLQVAAMLVDVISTFPLFEEGNINVIIYYLNNIIVNNIY